MTLTGKFTFRKSLRGKIVLQVEEEVKPFWRRSAAGALKRRWRDAKVMDLSDPELRHLIDLRFKPFLRSLGSFAPEATPAQRGPVDGAGTQAPHPNGGPRPDATVIRIAH